MSGYSSPHPAAIEAAIEAAATSPCSKSMRGAVIYLRTKPGQIVAVGGRPFTGEVILLARGTNSPPGRFRCDGTDACRAACREICVHAEAAAMISMRAAMSQPVETELVHVKLVDGKLHHSGPPSCHRCSALILAHPSIRLVWLLHESGWRSYTPEEFHLLSLNHNGLPGRLAVAE